jgi:hypothetical protein
MLRGGMHHCPGGPRRLGSMAGTTRVPGILAGAGGNGGARRGLCVRLFPLSARCPGNFHEKAYEDAVAEVV